MDYSRALSIWNVMRGRSWRSPSSASFVESAVDGAVGHKRRIDPLVNLAGAAGASAF